MEDQKPMSFTFEILNFSEKGTTIPSPIFSSGGCEWFVEVYYPKGNCINDHLSLYLRVANPESLPLRWKRRADFSIRLLNQSGEELSRISVVNRLFCAKLSVWGEPRAVPIQKLLKNSKLIVKAEVKIVVGDVTGNEVCDVSGFQVLYSQVHKVSWLFKEHRDIALNLRSKNQLVKAAYMNTLLGLIETLNKPAHSITGTELETAQSELMELTEAGFKLDWLKNKIDEISLQRKKAITDGSRVRQLEEHNTNLKAELDTEKVKSAAKVLSLEKKVSDLKVELDNQKVKSTTLEKKVSDLKTKLNMNKKKKWFGCGT